MPQYIVPASGRVRGPYHCGRRDWAWSYTVLSTVTTPDGVLRHHEGGKAMAFTVDYATLHKAAGDVRSTRAEVDGDLKRLASLAEELGGQWRGQAASGFSSLMARFGEDATKLQRALGDIADLLDKEANAHQHNDE